eukprot:CAMPEP_0170565786 /NCGR_PEP_ID=MMETSP0211-20121228/79407_1 /TAXON_ID=311385 /ORGANISM="Pseudokeronopsis sp., Strain OXSARD2" /LENGTH=284 /DNA_ID=CAMNT_0010886753 /DNA_START=172 /DNA_END=1024 /DNA_ORIENTATION=-
MIDAYMHLVPRFLRTFFESNLDVIKVRHLERFREVEGIAHILEQETWLVYLLNYEVRHLERFREVEGIAHILEQETWLVYLLNYAFELSKVLCTSIVARQADGTIIHGRNMDFAFPDAMRNASYIASFYSNGEYLYDAVMFGGYVGVLSAYKENAFSFTLNARGVDKGIVNAFEILGQIYIGLPEAGMAIREIFEAVKTSRVLWKPSAPPEPSSLSTPYSPGLARMKGSSSAKTLMALPMPEESMRNTGTNCRPMMTTLLAFARKGARMEISICKILALKISTW